VAGEAGLCGLAGESALSADAGLAGEAGLSGVLGEAGVFGLFELFAEFALWAVAFLACVAGSSPLASWRTLETFTMSCAAAELPLTAGIATAEPVPTPSAARAPTAIHFFRACMFFLLRRSRSRCLAPGCLVLTLESSPARMR
jgi:hypothetical protein